MFTVHTGHTARLRSALRKGGFPVQAKIGHIFNDHYRRKYFRRLKIWFATEIFSASHARQRKLEKAIREEFGDEILVMYFAALPYYHGGGKSLIIRLKPDAK